MGVYEKEIKEKDKEETIWTNIKDVEKTLSYLNLKQLWNTIKGQVEKAIQNI